MFCFETRPDEFSKKKKSRIFADRNARDAWSFRRKETMDPMKYRHHHANDAQEPIFFASSLTFGRIFSFGRVFYFNPLVSLVGLCGGRS